MDRRRRLAALIAFMALVATASAIGSAVTAPRIDDWYATLAKPSFNPPDWIFAPVWTALFVAMAIAAWLVWLRRPVSQAPATFGLFGLQLALNVLWSVLFFGMRNPGLALLEIVFLWGAILATMIAFWRVRPASGWLFVPYLAWVSFAAILNASIWMSN